MTYEYEIAENVDKTFNKLDRWILEIIDKKIKQICKDPYHFKPLRADMKNKRSVHIIKSYVLVYKIIEEQKKVQILNYDHHDRVYG